MPLSPSVHVASVNMYVGVFLALLGLTGLTVLTSCWDMGEANIFIALSIATCKAALVAIFFMHLSHENRFNTFAFLFSFLVLGCFLLLTADDQLQRGKLDEANGSHMLPSQTEDAPGGMPHSQVGGSASP